MPPRNFYNLPPSWNPGYEIPDYVMAEPPGRGTFTTSWLPRGTISGLVPEFQAVKVGRKILGRNDAGLGSLGDDTLGVGVGTSSTSGKDPITAYGQKSASWIMHSIKSVPADQRAATLRAMFDAIEPGLNSRIESVKSSLQAKGMAAPQALQHAIAVSMSKGMLEELKQVGKRAMRGERAPVKRTGHVALGVYNDAVPRAQTYALEALGFSLSSLNPVNVVKNVASSVAGAVGGAAKSVGSFVEKGIKAVGSLACQVVQSGAGQVAATAAAGPAGGAGAAAAASVCQKPSPIDPYSAPPPPPAPSTPGWVKPVAIGGAVLGGALLLHAVARR
jgi:hypothetical protein